MNPSTDENILVLDIGGSHIKGIILNKPGEPQSDYVRLATPVPASPAAVIDTIKELTKSFPGYGKISAGFPGYVKAGVIKTAPNLDAAHWVDVDFTAQLSGALGRPVKIVNDADLQGLGIASGSGWEMVITLGTGFGTALLLDGKLLPHLELAHHPVSKQRTYDEYVGEKALEDEGTEKWNRRVQKVIEILKTVFNYDRLYISGGNAKKISFPLEANIAIAGNKDGIKGGAKLWM